MLIRSFMPSRQARNGLECLLSVEPLIKAHPRRLRQMAESPASLAGMLVRLQKRNCVNKFKPFDSGMLSIRSDSTVAVLVPVRNAEYLLLPSWGALWVGVWNLRLFSRAVSVQIRWWANSFGILNLYHTRSANSRRCVSDG